MLNPPRFSFSVPSGFIEISDFPLVLKSVYSCVARIDDAFNNIPKRTVENTMANFLNPLFISFLVSLFCVYFLDSCFGDYFYLFASSFGVSKINSS